MEDLELTTRAPDETGPFGAATVPMPKLEIEPLVTRAAEGTRSHKALPPPRTPRGSVPPPIPARAKTASLPPPIPAPRASARIAAVPPPVPSRASMRVPTAIVPPLPPPVMPAVDVAIEPAHDETIDPASTTEAFFNEPPAERDQTFVPPRRAAWKYAVGAGIAGAAICGLVAFAMTRGDAPAAAPALATAPITAPPVAPKVDAPKVDVPVAQIARPAPVEAPIARPAAAPTTELSIHSWPQGATVTLIEDGNARVIGKTPLVAKIDPARSNDVVVSAHDRPTAMRHLEADDRELIVDLESEPVTLPAAKPSEKPSEKAIAKPAAKQVVAPKPRAAIPSTPAPVASTPAPKSPASRPTQAPTQAAPKQVAQVAPTQAIAQHAMPANTGALDVSTKPPCEIFIDGQSTRLTTPQRGIALSPGAHSVTFKNPGARIQKSAVVRIEKGRTTKLIQDFLH